jgi:hypothetical protein
MQPSEIFQSGARKSKRKKIQNCQNTWYFTKMDMSRLSVPGNGKMPSATALFWIFTMFSVLHAGGEIYFF